MRKFTSLLLLGFALGSFAQTPGGVSGSELWFKTAPLNSDLQGYYRWQDFSGDSIRLMLLDSRGVKSELTLPNSSVHFFNFNPSLWLADGFRSLSAKLKHGNLSQATVIGVFAPELATIGKDMVVYALDGRKGDGAILSKDKAVRGRRIPDGTYPIINPTAGSQWIKPGVGGNVSKRGIRFHYGGTNPRFWTEGCFVLSSGYSVNGNTIHYNADESKTASRNFDNALGAIGHFSYRPKSRTYNREGATFNAPIKHTLILKSRKK